MPRSFNAPHARACASTWGPECLPSQLMQKTFLEIIYMKQRIRQIKEILDHPVNRSNRLKAFVRYLKWNVGRRLLDRADYAIRITPSAQLILSNRENYATLAYTCGLYDFEDMQFLLHYLRPGDVFGDFGANVGVYSVLAGSVGATVLAVEPIPDTYARLQRNLFLNTVPGRAVQCGLSDSRGELRFTTELGGLNHVATGKEAAAIEVAVLTGDELVAETGLTPKIMKIDVEGFELPLLRGSSGLLSNAAAVIIELNGSGKSYGHSDVDVHNLLIHAGFGCFDYLPESRELHARSDYHHDRFNSLYVSLMRLDEVRSRITLT
jgi:FkbM family methyltransferase